MKSGLKLWSSTAPDGIAQHAAADYQHALAQAKAIASDDKALEDMAGLHREQSDNANELQALKQQLVMAEAQLAKSHASLIALRNQLKGIQSALADPKHTVANPLLRITTMRRERSNVIALPVSG